MTKGFKILTIAFLFLVISSFFASAGYDIWYYKADTRGEHRGFVLKHYWDYKEYGYGCKDELGAVDWRCYRVYYQPPISNIRVPYPSYFYTRFYPYSSGYVNSFEYVRNN